jgi:hypothetical protein
MISGHGTRSLYESRKRDGGPGRFVRDMRHMLGLCNSRGNPYRDHVGNSILRDPTDAGGRSIPRLRPSEFGLRDLYEGIIGERDVGRGLHPARVFRASLYEAEHPIMEAGTGAIAASQFADINAFTATVAGLLEVSVLEGFRLPEFIGDKLMPADNTRMFAGRKVIGATRMGDSAEVRQPGMPTARINIGERWITQPQTVENALASEVTQEAVYLDLTGEVLQNASDVGTWLGYHKELRVIDAWIGVTNTYQYKGTNYNTWISNGYFNNDLPNNELNHWDNVQTALLAFRDMKDPETNTRILTMPDTMLVNMEKLVVANSIVGNLGSEVEFRDAPGSTTNPQQIRHFQTPYKGKFEVIESPLVYQRLTDASGLNLSASTAGKYWWLYQKGKVAKYAQNWPIRTQQAAPSNLEMIDRGIVLYIKADERGTPMIFEPRYGTRSKP